MATTFYNPKETDDKSVLPVHLGGLGADNLVQGAKNIGLLTKDMLDVPGGVAIKSNKGKIKMENIPPALINRAVNLKGPTETFVGIPIRLQITDYDSFTNYELYVDNGTVSRDRDYITYVGGVAGVASLDVNGILFPILVKEPGIYKPTVTSPAANYKVNSAYSYVIGSEFTSIAYGDTHKHSQVDVSRYADFSVIEASFTNEGLSIDKTMVPIMLEYPDSEYFIRMRYVGTVSGSSSWSRTKRIVTTTEFHPAYENIKLTSSSSETNSRFGSTVAVNAKGNTAVVCTAGRGTYKAKLYIYERLEGIGNWILTTTHDINDSDAGNYLGAFPNCLSINADGNVIAIGGPNFNAGRGIVYIVRRNDRGEWVDHASIKSPVLTANEYFGYSVSLNGAGNMVAVGAPTAASFGRCYVFSTDGNTWRSIVTLSGSEGGISDKYGSTVSLSIDGKSLIVGGPNTASTTGRAYIYKYNNTTFTQSHKLEPPDLLGGGRFGYSVDINEDGTVATVSAIGVNKGKVYVFKVAGTYKLISSLEVDDTKKNDIDNYGTLVNVSATGHIVSVATTNIEELSNDKNNLVDVYTLDEDLKVTSKTTLVAGDVEGPDAYGWSMALSKGGESLLVGSPLKADGSVTDAGSVYVFN